MPPTEDRETTPAARFLSAPVRVVNVGLEGFSEDLRANGAEVVQLDWSPPAGGDARMRDLLARLRA